MAQGSKLALVLAFLTLTAGAQEPKLVNVAAFSNRAVNFVASHTARNPGAYVVGTEQAISRKGTWSVRKYGVKGCAADSYACVAVLYKTADPSIVCEWTVQIANDATKDTLVNLNEDAARFYLFRLSAEEARKTSADHKQPAFIYPLVARAAHLSGQAFVLLTLGADGTVSTVRTLTGPPLMRDAVEDYFRHWQFDRRSLHGHPVSSYVYAHYTYTYDHQGAGFDDGAPPKELSK